MVYVLISESTSRLKLDMIRFKHVTEYAQMDLVFPHGLRCAWVINLSIIVDSQVSFHAIQVDGTFD